MHGRLKVRTTEEQQERKRIEREKKLKIYKYAMSECMGRVHNSQYNLEGLKMSEEILSNNGDIQTLWSMRKMTLELFEKENTCTEEEMIKYYTNEMSITEFCLKKNPKSYSCWHHRRWCLTKANELNYASKSANLSWPHELKLCDAFLNADERNFHCWRHRSFVIEAGQLSKLDELEFTFEKICSNFSNYSAWHYRSKLIETLYNENKIDVDIFTKELNLIEQALFTDPNDQSAWIYEKWLIIEHQRSNVKELTLNVETGELNLRLSKILNINNYLLYLKVNGEFLKSPQQHDSSLRWEQKLDDTNVWHATVPIDKHLAETAAAQNQLRFDICLRESGVSIEILLNKTSSTPSLFQFKSKFDVKDLHLDKELIENHLANILELSKLESDNSKWCLLTSVELMCMIDFKKYEAKIFEHLDKLANEVDVFRKNFYLDLKNKISFNNSLLIVNQ